VKISPVLEGKKIGLLTAFVSRRNGGVFEAVVAQAEMIRALGGEAQIFGLADEHAEQDAPRFAPSQVTTCAIAGPVMIGYSPSMVGTLLDAGLDLLHLHGIWMYPSRAATRWARQTRRPYLVSPHGMLDPWITARGRWKKALGRAGYERASWKTASVLHGLTQREAGDISRETGRTDSVIVPNPGPIASPTPNNLRPPHVLYLGRIHPKKNLEALVSAWSCANLPAGSRLTIAGWGAEEDIARLQAVLARAGEGIEFVGQIYGDAKQKLLHSARFLVLPSHSEGLPMAVLEAWSAGTPAIMTAECNLPAGFDAGASLECGYDAADITPVLEKALGLGEHALLYMALSAR
jgi:glycosyltransferase involved in cell wall biosynthesis